MYVLQPSLLVLSTVWCWS